MIAGMKFSALVCAFAAALLSLGSLAHADEYERGHRGEGGRRWGGEQRPWQAQAQGQDGPRWQQGRGRWQQPQPYPQQPYHDQRIERRGPPPGYGPVPPQPQYVPQPQWQGPPPQYAPPQWQAPPPQRWNPQSRGFRPGDVLPPQYRQRQFVVSDWRAHRLYAPPPGYMWVQPEPGSYLLIGSNGTIANMLVGQ
jgi:Ni/Co efflux regulator RcnB